MAARSISLRSLRSQKLPELIARLLESPLPARVQRIGDQTLRRVSQRYPAVARLVSRGEQSLREGAGAALLERFGIAWPGRAEPPATSTRATSVTTAAHSAQAAAAAPAPSTSPEPVPAGTVATTNDTAEELGGTTADTPARSPQGPGDVLPVDSAERSAASLKALREGLAQGSWSARVEAIRRFGEEAGPPAVPALVAMLSDGSAEVAASAADCLGALGERASSTLTQDIEQSLRYVLADPEGYWSPVTRAASVAALVRCIASRGAADDATLGPVDDALRDIDAEVSLATIASLALLPHAVAAPRLRKLLEDESGFFIRPVRLAAARVLASLGLDPAERDELLSVERDVDVRAALSA